MWSKDIIQNNVEWCNHQLPIIAAVDDHHRHLKQGRKYIAIAEFCSGNILTMLIGQTSKSKTESTPNVLFPTSEVASTQWNIQMMYYKTVYLKHIMLLTDVTQ